MHKRIDGLVGTFRQKNKSINFSLERARIGSSLLSGLLNITDPENPRMELTVEFSFMDTTDFTAPPGYVSGVTWGDWINKNHTIRYLSRCRGNGFLKIAKGKTAYHSFSDFKAAFDMTPGTVKAVNWQCSYAEGLVKGNAVFDIKQNARTPFSLHFLGDKIKLDHVTASDSSSLMIFGNMFLDGRLEWKLGPSLDNSGIFKTGHVDVRLEDGVIDKFDVLSKIFSLLNLGSILRGKVPDLIKQGLPFQRVTWATDVLDTKWRVKNLKLLSDAARVDASGMYFSHQKRVDFKVGVSPLVGIDALVTGLFGNLITRDGKTLTTTFRVRGLYSSPDVRLEPFESLRVDE